MNTSPIKAIVITGHYAAGKGDVAARLLPLLTKRFPSLTCLFRTDRELLDEAVWRDVYDEQAPKTGTEGPHSIIRDIGPPLVFDVKDGTLHRETHTSMVEGIRNTPRGELRVLEIASGPDVAGFGLLQSGHHLAGLLRQFDATEHTLVIDVYAPFSVRMERNARRPNRVSEEIMRIAASDGGRVFDVRHILASRYYLLDNTDNGGTARRVRETFGAFVAPSLETTAVLDEGNARPTGWRK